MQQAMTPNAMIRFKLAKDALKKKFEDIKTGEQTQYEDMSKLYKPLIDNEKVLSKVLQDKLVENKEAISNVLVPFTQQLEKRNELQESFQSLPFYGEQQGIADAPHSTPRKQKVDIIDLNKHLNDTDVEILQSLSFDLPDTLYKSGPKPEDLDIIFKQIKSQNRSNGQLNKVKHPELYEQTKTALTKYKKALETIQGGKEYIVKSGEGIKKLCKQKQKRGRPKKYTSPVIYINENDLCIKLSELVQAKQAGNTGLDNTIIACMDKMLEIKVININVYNKLFKNFFPHYY
jgi:hypothetical protein